jgi:aminoacyl-tRNA hydrolase
MWLAYRLAYLRRRSLTRTIFIGITGSAGKTTTKDLIASILARQHRHGRKGSGTLNGPLDVARLLLGTRRRDRYCVTEIAITKDAGIDLPLALFRPTVGVVTNIGSDHLSSYGSLDGIAEEKSKLIRALPASGVAVLNGDDPRVLAMGSKFAGRVITYGMHEQAMLRPTAIEMAWPDRLSFTVHWKGQAVRVQTQLCGRHWVAVVLAALATAVAMDIPLEAAAAAVADVEPFEGRMSPVQLEDGVTFIRDDWKAPLWTVAPTFDFMREARASRKVIVIGTISDYAGDSARRYVQIGRQALAVADAVIFIGPWASSSLRAKRGPDDNLWAFGTVREAAAHLSRYLRFGDLVLLKGSTRADHLERLILTRTTGVECWRTGCGRMCYCNQCSLLHVASAVPLRREIVRTVRDSPDPSVGNAPATAQADAAAVIVIGLGNPGVRYDETPHNVGRDVVDVLAQRLGGTWTPACDKAVIIRTQWEGRPVWLIKLETPMNDAGPTLLPIAEELGFSIRQCILVHDDLDLPLGSVRSRMRGGAGGHRGVQSIVESFQEDQVRRVKIGVGRPPDGMDVLTYVLTPFAPQQRAAVKDANHLAADRVTEMIRQAYISKSPPVSSKAA